MGRFSIRYWNYLKYLIRYKFYVFRESRKLGITWREFWHDWEKFLPGMFIGYAKHFYDISGKPRYSTFPELAK